RRVRLKGKRERSNNAANGKQDISVCCSLATGLPVYHFEIQLIRVAKADKFETNGNAFSSNILKLLNLAAVCDPGHSFDVTTVVYYLCNSVFVVGRSP